VAKKEELEEQLRFAESMRELYERLISPEEAALWTEHIEMLRKWYNEVTKLEEIENVD
jgi:hypothetical protein